MLYFSQIYHSNLNYMDLLIDTFGTKIGSTGERIVLSFPKIKEKREYPINRVSKIVILRPASLTTNAVQLALNNDVDIVYLGSFGKPIGRILSSESKGLAQLRRAQLETSVSSRAFDLAKVIVKGKCLNQIGYIKKLSQKYSKNFNKEILQMETTLKMTENLQNNKEDKERLLGVEGYIAERYFNCFRKLYKFSGRKPEGRDKFNSAFNYGYGMLYNEVERACLYAGLDPYIGIYHGEGYGKPSLVLDLVEEFRTPIIDSVIFPLFINKKLTKKGCFDLIGKGQYQLSHKGKKILVESVLKRLNTNVMYEDKQYPLKVVIENQIRAVSQYFMNKRKEYIPFNE